MFPNRLSLSPLLMRGGLSAGRLRAFDNAVNLITNSRFVGAVAGTPGTAPTSWSIGFGGGSLAVADTTVTTSTAAAARQYLSTGSIVMPANTTYTMAVEFTGITVAGGSEAIATVNVTAGGVTGTTSLLSSGGLGRKSMTFTTGASGATVQIRVGAGVGINTAGATSIAFKEPQLEVGAIARTYVPT